MRSLRVLTPLVLGVALLAACDREQAVANRGAVEPTAGTACVLDGMLLAEHPGPKAQIHYVGQDEPDFFCDTVEMFHLYLEPEQVRPIAALFVQDMGQAAWDAPQGHWIDARTAWYVVGSKRRGSMGTTIASFALEADARAFASRHGGEVVAFDAVKPEKARLDGGALHDHHM